MKILIVDDELEAVTTVKRLLRRRGYRDVETCLNGNEAMQKIRTEDFDLVLLDYLMPEIDGLKVLTEAQPYKLSTEFLMLTEVDDLPTAVQAIRLGAYDYLLKPLDTERLLLSIERAYERKGTKISLTSPRHDGPQGEVSEAFSGIITRCPRMKALLLYAHVMAKSGNPILITGESGTGKELLARSIHEAGLRPEGPFVAVNVSSIPESLFERQFLAMPRGPLPERKGISPAFLKRRTGAPFFLMRSENSLCIFRSSFYAYWRRGTSYASVTQGEFHERDQQSK